MGQNQSVEKLYVDLLKKCLSNTIYEDSPEDPWSGAEYDGQRRAKGLDWPSKAHTMIGLERLQNIQFCAESIIANKVPGDFIEAGVWRGGAAIFMRGILKAYHILDKVVWAADSFSGLPVPNSEVYPADKGDRHHTFQTLSVSLEDVKDNFDKYGLLDSQVRFLKGWFKDTLPDASIDRLSLLRIDGDMYESTINALENLYNKVYPGGYVIIDDYHAVSACKGATEDFRINNKIEDQLMEIDGVGVFWQKS